MKPVLTKVKTIRPDQFAGLDALHEYTIRAAEHTMHKKGKVPCRWIVRAQDRLMTIDTPWDGDGEKDSHRDFMRFVLGATGATVYSFMTEAWIATYKEGDKAEFVMPSDNPDSEDVLMVSTYTRTDHRLTRYGIRYSDRHRPKFGRLLVRDDWNDHDRSGFEGRMFNLMRGLPETLPEYIPVDILTSREHFGIMLGAFEKVRAKMMAGEYGERPPRPTRSTDEVVKDRIARAAAARNARNPMPPLPEVIIVPPAKRDEK